MAWSSGALISRASARELWRKVRGVRKPIEFIPLDQVRSMRDLYPWPLRYERTAFMEHIRQYDRKKLHSYYLHQPVTGAAVWANYVVNLWEYEHGVEELTSYPWIVTLPMTEVCNAICPFCSSPLVPDPKEIKIQEIQHFAEALRYAIRISLQGLGEPLAHPQFEAIAGELKKHLNPVASLEMITNGWLLSGHRWDLLKEIQLEVLQVSVNAATDRTHQIAMGSKPGTFDRVVKNIEDIMADDEWSGTVKVSMVITKHSLPEVTQFLDMFVERGVKLFQFNALLPLTTSDWGFGHTDQYLDLWCGHLPNAHELVEQAKKSIAMYSNKGVRITATPEQWLEPADQWRRANLIQLSLDEKKTAVVQDSSQATATYSSEWQALCVWVGDKKTAFPPHARHAEVVGNHDKGVSFRGTAESCRWAYLLRTPRIPLSAGEYVLDLDVRISSGSVYGGILDIETDDFLMQEKLASGRNQIGFVLSEDKLVNVIIRQGDSDAAVAALYRSGRVRRGVLGAESIQSGVPQGTPREGDVPATTRGSSTTTEAAPTQIQVDSPKADVEAIEPEGQGPDKSGRIYCPMVYSTLSIFHHSLDVSVCCYMENAPGHIRANLKETPVLRAYNDPGFRLVRRTLNSKNHIPVCEACPYGGFRS